MAIIVDVSAIIPLAFADEDHGYSASVVHEIAQTGGVVPALFWFEVWNVLTTNELRRGRITQPQSELFLTLLGELNLETAPLPDPIAVLQLARSQGVTAYDAAYLATALQFSTSLATQDAKLATAAAASGIDIYRGKDQQKIEPGL